MFHQLNLKIKGEKNEKIFISINYACFGNDIYK